MAWKPNPKDDYECFMFRALDDEEEAAFRAFARENDPPRPDWSLFHPVCREEWTRRGLTPHFGGDK